jgi:hypothetical protein
MLRVFMGILQVAKRAKWFQRRVALLDKETDSGDAAHCELGPLFNNTVRME